MKILVWAIGKTDEKYLIDGIQKYLKRLVHYASIEFTEFKDVKSNQNADHLRKTEAEMILSKLKKDDYLILLDERGLSYTSVDFSQYINKLQINAHKTVIFLIGGAFGFHATLRERANHSISLSKMTFSHQMVRLFLVEQIYRAYTIINNEKYHNE